MHPTVWGAVKRLWQDGHFRQAVASAGEAVAAMVKTRTGRNDIPETALWQQVFSEAVPKEWQPRLRWPGHPADRQVKNMNDGLRQFAPGVQMTVRNTATHDAGPLDQQIALEQLATLSLLARWVDVQKAGQCADSERVGAAAIGLLSNPVVSTVLNGLGSGSGHVLRQHVHERRRYVPARRRSPC